MISNLLKSKKFVYCIMTLLVFMWGFEYVAAKEALRVLSPFTLIFYKYLIASTILLVIRLIQKRKFPLKKKHIITLVLCSICGEILYFGCEYSAMDYLPVSIISIILAFVPMLSIVLEIFISKKYPNLIIVIGIVICIIGVCMVIGFDVNELASGKIWGYLLAFGAVVFWNGYNFITEKLSDEYDPYDLTFMQLSCTVVLTIPFAFYNSPGLSELSPAVIGGVLYLSTISALIGFMIYVIAISVIGPTPCSLYSNFLPVTAALFGWIFLGETLSGIQMLGGVIIIGSGAVVIWQKGKLDEKYEKLKET